MFDAVLSSPEQVVELFDCYESADEVVRLRVSNALRRVQAERPDLVVPLVERLLAEILELDQPSAQWTLPKLFAGAEADMNSRQQAEAIKSVKRNLAQHSEWIVRNNSITYLSRLALSDKVLRSCLLPHVNRHSKDTRNSVAKRARKAQEMLGGSKNA